MSDEERDVVSTAHQREQHAGYTKRVEGVPIAGVDGVVSFSELQKQLLNLRGQYKRLQQQCAANLRREARASAEAINELERNLQTARAQRDAAMKELIARNSEKGEEPAAAPPVDTSRPAQAEPIIAKGFDKTLIKKFELQSRLDTSLLAFERRRLAEVYVALRASEAALRAAREAEAPGQRKSSDARQLKQWKRERAEAFKLIRAAYKAAEDPDRALQPRLLEKLRAFSERE